MEAEPGSGDYLPGYLRRKGGFRAASEAMETARTEAGLPSFNATDYRFTVKPPGGVPFSTPVQVIYKPDSPDEHDLGTFRVGR